MLIARLNFRGRLSVAGNFSAVLAPINHRVADSRHRFLGDFARLGRALVENSEHLAWVGRVFFTARSDRSDPPNQVIGHSRLTIDAADARAAATLSRPLQRSRR